MTDVALGAGAPRRAAVLFILVAVAIDVLAFGIVIPVLPKLVEGFVGGDTARAARVFGLFGTAWALMQFVFSPVLGALSDRFGRRPVLLVSILGLGLDYVFMALAPNLFWLFIGRLVSGITAANFSTATAYIADVTPPEARARNFGLIGAAFGLGFVLGPALGGLLGEIDPRLPFWAAAGLALANGAYGLFMLPESLPPERRRALSWRRANPVGSLKLLRSHPELFGLSGVATLYYLAHEVLPAVFVLYVGYRYGWDALAVGLALALIGVCTALVQGGLTGPIVARLGERRALVVGLLCGAAGFTLFGLGEVGWAFLLGIPVMAFWGIAGPAEQGLMTRRVSASEQGELQGALAALRGITGLVGPFLFTLTFAAFIEGGGLDLLHLPGAPFLLAAALLAGAAWLGWRVTREG
jgi:DHA1 family tetracycline resistance protein-like MFS transporter